MVKDVIPRAGVSGIVMHGEGRHFSSGADLDNLVNPGKNSEPVDPGMLRDNIATFVALEQLSIPVIAAIRGVCLGSALELALFCHCRICGEGSVLGLPETTFGLIPGCGGIQKLNAIAGKQRAMELILSGESFTAEDAHAWKIVDKIVQKKDVVESAIQLIAFINGEYDRSRMSWYINHFNP